MPRFTTPFERIPADLPLAATGALPFDADFVYLQGKDDLTEFWWTPRWVYDGLRDGSLGYVQVAEFETPAHFAPQRRHDSMQISVNPHILVFARRDRADALRARSQP